MGWNILIFFFRFIYEQKRYNNYHSNYVYVLSMQQKQHFIINFAVAFLRMLRRSQFSTELHAVFMKFLTQAHKIVMDHKKNSRRSVHVNDSANVLLQARTFTSHLLHILESLNGGKLFWIYSLKQLPILPWKFSTI